MSTDSKFRIERLANGLIRVDFRGSGLVGLYEVFEDGQVECRSGQMRWLGEQGEEQVRNLGLAFGDAVTVDA